jgi:hypothetical protein
MESERIAALLAAQERSWAWLARQIEVPAGRMWRLRHDAVPWRHREARAAASVLGVPFAALFGAGERVLPPGRDRATPPRAKGDAA